MNDTQTKLQSLLWFVIGVRGWLNAKIFLSGCHSQTNEHKWASVPVQSVLFRRWCVLGNFNSRHSFHFLHHHLWPLLCPSIEGSSCGFCRRKIVSLLVCEPSRYHHLLNVFSTNIGKMRLSPISVTTTAFACAICRLPLTTTAWVAPVRHNSIHVATTTASPTLLFSTTQDEEQDTKATSSSDDTRMTPSVINSGKDLTSHDDTTATTTTATPNSDGLPWWWESVWQLDMMKTGEPGTACTFGDTANVLRTNIEQIYGGYPSLDGCPIAEGAIANIADGTMFLGLQNYQQTYGSPYKFCFGPKSFLVVSDPIQAKHLLREANTNYDKVGNTHTVSQE